MTFVFVSYSRIDSEFVLKLVRKLRERNVSVWLDQDSIGIGERWDVAIEKALDEATHILVMLSPASVESQNVRDEIDLAMEEKKIIVPVMISRCKPPLRIRRMQYTEFLNISEYDEALEKLLIHLPKVSEDIPAPPLPGLAEPEHHQTILSPVVKESASELMQDDQLQRRFAEKIYRSDYPSLVVIAGSLPNQSWLLTKSNTIVGRNETCDVIIPVRQVSREHITIFQKASKYFVRDENSSNGTWINGTKLEAGTQHELRDGDEITLAMQLILRFDERIDRNQFTSDTVPIEPRNYVPKST